MINKVILTGRLTKDPIVRCSNKTNSPTTVANYTLAINEFYGGENHCHFIDCSAWGEKHTGFAEKYFRKGMKVEVIGSLRTNIFKDRNNHTIRTTTVFVEYQNFAENKANSSSSSYTNVQKKDTFLPIDEEGFCNIPDGIDEELPF